MSDLEGLDELRSSCPPGTRLVGPAGPDGSSRTVNGQITAECRRPDGTPHGPSVTWHEKGSKASAGEYREGLKDGQWAFWHANRQLSGRGDFHEGKPHGVWLSWHDNGEKESEGSYVQGLQEGEFTHWDRNGQITQVVQYQHGKMIKSIPYKDGRPLE